MGCQAAQFCVTHLYNLKRTQTSIWYRRCLSGQVTCLQLYTGGDCMSAFHILWHLSLIKGLTLLWKLEHRNLVWQVFFRQTNATQTKSNPDLMFSDSVRFMFNVKQLGKALFMHRSLFQPKPHTFWQKNYTQGPLIALNHISQCVNLM